MQNPTCRCNYKRLKSKNFWKNIFPSHKLTHEPSTSPDLEMSTLIAKTRAKRMAAPREPIQSRTLAPEFNPIESLLWISSTMTFGFFLFFLNIKSFLAIHMYQQVETIKAQMNLSWFFFLRDDNNPEMKSSNLHELTKPTPECSHHLQIQSQIWRV